MPTLANNNTESQPSASGAEAIKRVVIESSQFVDHASGAKSRISYPTISAWEKQTNCVHKLKSLSQKYVSDKQQQQTQVTSVSSAAPRAVDPLPPDCGSTAKSTLYETFSAAAGQRSSKSCTCTEAKAPIPLYKFFTDMAEHTSKLNCTTPSCGPVVEDPKGKKAATGMDGFDASTFDSILDMTEDGTHFSFPYGHHGSLQSSFTDE